MLKGKNLREKTTGRFASPSLIKGRGLGTAYSTDERNRQSETKNVSESAATYCALKLKEVDVAHTY